ncbi:chaplin [Streptomyces sp. CB01881]|uniref:chaplin n=1 Tax=Streptomyces sp. CB01881 TaxID=2078691 RepID=UPI001F11AA97|nr:chaplin [Streptomyces sp. CB01881]
MTNTRKYLFAVGFSAALAVISAGPAFAGDCDSAGYSAHAMAPAVAPAVAPPAGIADGLLLDGSQGGTTCINTGSATASGIVTGSPGVLSGNQIQIPINAQFNICGNSISLLGG